MKTTLDIDPELYSAAEKLARAQHKSLAQVITDLLRRALGSGDSGDTTDVSELERRNGFSVFPERPGPKATVEGVRDLCREEGI